MQIGSGSVQGHKWISVLYPIIFWSKLQYKRSVNSVSICESHEYACREDCVRMCINEIKFTRTVELWYLESKALVKCVICWVMDTLSLVMFSVAKGTESLNTHKTLCYTWNFWLCTMWPNLNLGESKWLQLPHSTLPSLLHNIILNDISSFKTKAMGCSRFSLIICLSGPHCFFNTWLFLR